MTYFLGHVHFKKQFTLVGCAFDVIAMKHNEKYEYVLCVSLMLFCAITCNCSTNWWKDYANLFKK